MKRSTSAKPLPRWAKKLEAQGIVLTDDELEIVASERERLWKYENERRLRNIARMTLPKIDGMGKVTPCD